MEKKIGLVFAGGGGKGAYHIGVWKALREYGIDKNITAVAGTSVGALNAALFAHGDYSLAEDIWLNISHQQILKNNIGPGGRVEQWFNQYTTSFFSRDGLKRIFNRLDFTRIYNGVPCYAACLKVSDENAMHFLFNLLGKAMGKAGAFVGGIAKIIGSYANLFSIRYFNLQEYDVAEMKKILLASSAIPGIFPEEKIGGNYYIDGGLVDNLPIKPLYDDGYRAIIAVQCSRDSTEDVHQYTDANILEIVPQNSQGKILDGTLDFSAAGARQRIDEGYRDACAILKELAEWHEIGVRQSNALNKMAADEAAYRSKMQQLNSAKSRLDKEIEKLLTGR